MTTSVGRQLPPFAYPIITKEGSISPVWYVYFTNLSSTLANVIVLPGSTSITTLGTITVGTWQGTPIANAYIANTAVASLSGVNTGDQTNITGNAGTVTNGVYTTGSYADPTWITSLAGSKITGGGTYTTTFFNVANLDSTPSGTVCQYYRIGNVVTVSGTCTINPTLAATSTQIGISLPIASAFASAGQCAGTAFAPGIAAQGAAILGDTSNARAQMQYISSDVSSQIMYFTFTYVVV